MLLSAQFEIDFFTLIIINFIILLFFLRDVLIEQLIKEIDELRKQLELAETQVSPFLAL